MRCWASRGLRIRMRVEEPLILAHSPCSNALRSSCYDGTLVRAVDVCVLLGKALLRDHCLCWY